MKEKIASLLQIPLTEAPMLTDGLKSLRPSVPESLSEHRDDGRHLTRPF